MGRGPWQRRAWAAGGLLHGFAGDARLPAYGYGIRYDYGIFHQRIVNGAQVEVPDAWLRYGNPWEIARPLDEMRVHYNGRVQSVRQRKGRLQRAMGRHAGRVRGALRHAHPRLSEQDTSTPFACGGPRHATNSTSVNFDAGDYVGAVQTRTCPRISPRCSTQTTTSTRAKNFGLKQEYFFVRPRLQDIIRRYKKRYRMFDQKQGLKTFDASPRKPRSSSMTPILRWRSPN